MKMFSPICCFKTTLFPKHGTYWYRSEVHRVRFLESESPNSTMPGRHWYYTIWIRMHSSFHGHLKWLHDHSQSEKYGESDHLRLSAPGWVPHSCLPPPLWTWRLDCWPWPLAHCLLREEGQVCWKQKYGLLRHPLLSSFQRSRGAGRGLNPSN